MVARILDFSCYLPHSTATQQALDANLLLHRDSRCLYAESHPLGAPRGLVFALVFEIAIVLIGFSTWQLWHLLR